LPSAIAQPPAPDPVTIPARPGQADGKGQGKGKGKGGAAARRNYPTGAG